MSMLDKRKHFMNRLEDGKEAKYRSSEKLLSKAFEYFAWCEDNPWHKKELMRSGDRKGDIVEVPVHRPYTLVGLCVYCGISEKTFNTYEKKVKLCDAVLHIRDIIKQNQIEGAIIGAYNSSLVMRLLGLTDNQSDNEATTSHSLTIHVSNPMTKIEIENMKEQLLISS